MTQDDAHSESVFLPWASLRWQGKDVPSSTVYGDCYYHLTAPLSEVEHVFVNPNALVERFSALTPGAQFYIGETGFGTGLNFAMVAALWQRHVLDRLQPDVAFSALPRLIWVSFEQSPLTCTQLKKAHQPFLDDKQTPTVAMWLEQLQAQYPQRVPGWHQSDWPGVCLRLYWGDALTGLKKCPTVMDAWCLDGFKPACNPQMWQTGLFQAMGRRSHEQTTFATFTAAGFVRRGLTQAGFAVKKVPGFGGKHDISCGHFQHNRPKPPLISNPPYEQTDGASPTALVIGAGLAGATTAYALAQAGFQVTVLDKAKGPAQGASGNLGGTVHPVVTADWNVRSQFYQQGLAVTRRWLLPWLAQSPSPIQGDLSGSLQAWAKPAMAQRFAKALARIPLPASLAHPLSAAELGQALGVDTPLAGVRFTQGGWLCPKSVVKACLAHPNITVAYGVAVQAINSVDASGSPWQVQAQKTQQPVVYQASQLVVATGALDPSLNRQLHLPIRPKKGQVTHLGAEALQAQLLAPVNHQGYTIAHQWPQAPSVAAITGATFEQATADMAVSDAAHMTNIQTAAQALGAWLQPDLDLQALGGRVGYRPTTADHLPIVGPVPDWAALSQWMQAHPPGQSREAAWTQFAQPRLWVNNGHGARGLMSVFMAADYLAALIQGRLDPLVSDYAEQMHPARFAIREWQKSASSKSS